ncbi:MAG: glycerophosphodiester phosphodiesterase [Gemmatimonadales bacterium]
MSNLSTRHHPLRIAHRGVSSRAVENSLRAFRLAVENPWGPCDGIELDIHSTRDGEFVVHHDPALPSGLRIAESTLDELRQEPLADGSPIPTLPEAMAASGGLRLYIEVKGLDPRWDGALLAIIRADAMPERCQLHAFDHRVTARLSVLAPEVTLGVLSASYPLDPVGPVLAAGARVLWQEAGLIDGALVEACAAAGVEVIAWTVNDAAEAARLAGLGVAGLCGNWPERLGGEA